MAVVNLPIPAENATIARGQIYQLTGLTEATRYKFIVTSTKCPHVVIAKDEALEQLEAEGYLSGRAFYFATEGGQTNAYLRIDALEGAEITLTMKADQIPAPEEATLPADLSPDKWYSIGDLVANTGYELKVSAEVPVTVFVKTGDTIADAIEEPPFVTAAGTARFTSTGTKAWVYVDGAVKANVDIVAPQGIDSSLDQNITGAWNFTNTAGVVLGNEVPLVLGQGADAVKIHGDGNGAAVIEGTNASHMDVAIPVKFQNPTTFDDGISFVATTGEKMKCILFGKESGPTRAIIYEESNGFLSITDPNNVNDKTLTIDGAGDLWVYRNENHNGVVTFNVQTRMHGTIDVGGVMSFRETPNANAGINIPLTVGAVTDTSAVNRLYAAGMAGVTGILTSNAFLNTATITKTGTSTVTQTVPYHLARITVPKGTHSTIQARFEVSNPQWNYSSFAGFSFLWRATNAAKLSFGIGRGGKTIRPDLSIDSYSIIPANDLAYNHGEILDITFDNVRDTQRNGYTVRVREIYALDSTAGWQVKTTTSFVPASQNEPVPWTIAKVIYQQKSTANIAKYEDTGALWLMLTGGQGYNLYQIATCRGVSNFETGVGISSWVTDVVNNAGGDVSVDAGIGEYTYYHPGNVNPVFYGLDAISRNCIESEEATDFVDINNPIEQA